jgi:nicotinic acetylcholine receptor
MWKPDLFLYNSVNENFDAAFLTNIIVNHDGVIGQIPPEIFKSTCKIDITWFPFDDQSCDMKFGTRTHHRLKINLSQREDASVDISGFQVSRLINLISLGLIITFPDHL